MKVMHSYIHLGHGHAAVKMFDEMLQFGAAPKAHLIGKAVSHKFFKLVAETLDDERIQEDGIRLLDLIQKHMGSHQRLRLRIVCWLRGRTSFPSSS